MSEKIKLVYNWKHEEWRYLVETTRFEIMQKPIAFITSEFSPAIDITDKRGITHKIKPAHRIIE